MGIAFMEILTVNPRQMIWHKFDGAKIKLWLMNYSNYEKLFIEYLSA